MPTDSSAARPRASRAGASSLRGRRRRPASRKGLVVALILSLAIILGVGTWALTARPWQSVVIREECTASANGASYTLTPNQAHYAAKIGAISVKRDLPVRAATIAIATATQESNLQNIDYGDAAGPDSRGLFQQRPSQGWGTEAQIMNPSYAINAFYDALVKVSGYQTMEITEAAQAVQRSALPDAYAKREPQARAFAAALRGQTEANLTCRLREATSPGSVENAQAALTEDWGLTGTAGKNSLSVKASDRAHGWGVAHWAVANASEYGIDSVTFAGRTWTRDGGWSEAKDSTQIQSTEVGMVFHS